MIQNQWIIHKPRSHCTISLAIKLLSHSNTHTDRIRHHTQSQNGWTMRPLAQFTWYTWVLLSQVYCDLQEIDLRELVIALCCQKVTCNLHSRRVFLCIKQFFLCAFAAHSSAFFFCLVAGCVLLPVSWVSHAIFFFAHINLCKSL